MNPSAAIKWNSLPRRLFSFEPAPKLDLAPSAALTNNNNRICHLTTPQSARGSAFAGWPPSPENSLRGMLFPAIPLPTMKEQRTGEKRHRSQRHYSRSNPPAPAQVPTQSEFPHNLPIIRQAHHREHHRRRHQPVHHSREIECANWIEAKKVERDANDCGHNDHRVKPRRLLRLLLK